MAKSAFLKWYSKQFAPRAFDGPPHIDIHLTTSPPSAPRKIFFRDSLREIIRMFDDYFFFGTLTRHRPCYLRPLVRLDAGNDLLKTHISPDRIYCGGICKGSSEFGYPYSEVAVFEALRDHSGPIYYASLQFAIRTLLHELLHAYIDVFICTCACCKKDIPNTRGFTGHGKTFLRMNTLMMEELNSWHPDFTAWWPYDLHGGFFFPLVSFREEEDEYRKWRSLPHFGRLNPLIQEDSPEKLVRMEINDRGCLVSVTCTHVWSKTETSKPTSVAVPEPTLEPAPEPTPQPTPETTPKSSSGPDSGSTSQDLAAIIDTSKTSKGFRLFIASLFKRGQTLVPKIKSKRHKKDE